MALADGDRSLQEILLPIAKTPLFAVGISRRTGCEDGCQTPRRKRRSGSLFLITLLMLAAGFAIQASAIDLPPMTTDSIQPGPDTNSLNAHVKALTVYGEDKFQMKSQKITRVMTKNINAPVESLMLHPLAAALTLSPGEELFQRSLVAADRVHSKQILLPLLLNQIPRAPFITFKPALAGKSVQSWTFKVNLPENTTPIYRQSGAVSAWPARVTWDGKDSDHRLVIEPGRKYVWEFAGLDRGGKKITGYKGTLNLAAFVIEEGKNQAISLAITSLYKPQSTTELSTEGKLRLNESADYVRGCGSTRLELMIYSDNKERATEQGTLLSWYLARRLLLEKEQVVVRVQDLRSGSIARFEIRFSRQW